VKWRVLLTPMALKLLSEISDRRIREKIGVVIERLVEEPEKQGKALLGNYPDYAA
jgi:mRNA interferase RelE/StbE